MTQLNLPFNTQNINLTPMMKQYLDIKSQYQDAIVFYRMGDFYEMFFQDAVNAAPVLGIALTKRGQHLGDDIPMCGVPFHSSEAYIAKLIEKGFKVVICEQMETPEEAKKRGYKAVVRRDVVRIITPGTLTEDNLLKSNSSNFLLAIACAKDEIALAWTDISTGEFYASLSSINSLANDLSRICPKEILISTKIYEKEEVNCALADFRRIVTIQANNLFELNKAENKIKSYFKIITSDIFGNYSSAELIACGAVLEYVELTQKTLEHTTINYPKRLNNSAFMSIDAATRRNLEITLNTNGERKGSLLSLLDQTKTSCGSRLLYQYLSAPLIDIEAINTRLDLVEFFANNIDFTYQIISCLSHFGDIERCLSRFSFNRGGPRDLMVIKNSIFTANQLYQILSCENLITQLQVLITNFNGFDDLMIELSQALEEDLPLLARDGGFIKTNYHPKLDQLKQLKNDSKIALNDLKQKYIQLTGISGLKINYNNVLGYFIDITPQHANKMKEEFFIHRQTLANSVRYTSLELRELEKDLTNVEDNILKLELEIYQQLVSNILNKSVNLILLAHTIANIDIATNFAILAKENNYTRPTIDNSYDFVITEGRHPVIEYFLKKQKEEFIPNNCVLNKQENLWLITGPNMAGKSTFLRQNAIIVIMAQIGCFVPAKFAHFGAVDKIFSRVGAADDLARGRSTFMVEMVETANILNNSTKKSLIILDEIGRGTSTYDGVSIASACLDFIHDQLQCRALFATHYHELTALSSQLKSLACYTMQIKEWQNKVIFMHKIIPGTADKSYGIHVAEMAGLPKIVIHKAQQILSNLEQNHNQVMEIDVKNIPSFNQHPIVKHVEQLDLDEISPKGALEILYTLKKLC